MPHWPPYYHGSGQIDQILSLLGNPQNQLPPVIHVTGTNGKGSVISFLKHILKAHGLKLHIFTSPHLLHINENFTIANQVISDAKLHALTEEIRIKLDGKIKPSFFEYQTALAFLAFSREKADLSIIECGMGAKHDPTNILSDKLMSIITPISFDHEEYLGDTLSSIAEHKAFIMCNSKTNIIAPQQPMVKKILNDFANLLKNKNSHKIINYEEKYDFDITENKIAYIDIIKEKISYYSLPKLAGDHQITNLAIAIAAAKNLNFLPLDDDKINYAINNSKWIGRLENLTNISSDILNSKSEIWFDGAHNEAGAYALSKWLKQQSNDKENLIIYGRSQNKNHHKFLQYLTHKNNKITFVTVKNEPLSETKFNFKKFLHDNPQYHIEIFDDLESVLLECNTKYKKPIRIIICGSLYLYRDLHQILD